MITSESDLRDRGWSVEPSTESVMILEGIAVPLQVRAAGPHGLVPTEGRTTYADDGLHLEVDARYSALRGHYLLHGLALTATGDDEINGTLLRTVAPLAVMRWILPRTFQFEPDRLSPAVASFVSPELDALRGAGSGRAGQSQDQVADVATVYRLASVVRYPPVKAVAEALGLQTRTATNWISRAREGGLL